MPITKHLSPRSVPLLLSFSPFSASLCVYSLRFRILCCRCSTPTLYVVCCHHPRSTVCCNYRHSLRMTTDTCEMQYLLDACTTIVCSMFSNPTYATLRYQKEGKASTRQSFVYCPAYVNVSVCVLSTRLAIPSLWSWSERIVLVSCRHTSYNRSEFVDHTDRHQHIPFSVARAHPS